MTSPSVDLGADKAGNRFLTLLGPWALFLLVAAIMVGPFVLPLDQIDTTSYDIEDSYIFIWNFWWTRTSVLSGSNPYWTDTIFYPAGTSLTFHSYPLPYSLASIPLQLAMPGLDGLTACYNITIFLSFVIAAFAAYRLALYVTASHPGALLAGLIYAFMPFHLLNAARLHVVAIEFLPFYVLAHLQMEANPRLRTAAAMGFWLGINYYTSLEYALYLVLFSCIRLIWVAASQPGIVTWKYLYNLPVAAGTFALFVSPLLYQQIEVSVSSGWDTIACPIDEAVGWSPALASFVTPSRGNPFFGELFAFAGSYRDGRTTGMRSETVLSFTALGLAALALLRGRGGGFWGFAFLAFLVCSLGPYLRLTGSWSTEIPLPWLALYELVPPFRGGREPARFFPLAMMALSILASFGVRRMFDAINRPRLAWGLLMLLGAAVLFEDALRWPVARIDPTVHSLHYRLADESGEFTIMDLTRESDRLLSHTVHQRPTADWRGFVVRSEQINLATPLVQLQADFEQPQRLLELGPDAAPEVARYRQALTDANVRYILLPLDGNPARFDLARMLGGKIAAEGPIAVCRVDGG